MSCRVANATQLTQNISSHGYGPFQVPQIQGVIQPHKQDQMQ